MKAYEEKWKGKLRGKIVLLSAPRVPKEQKDAQFRRYTDQQLSDIANAPEPAAKLTIKDLDKLEWPENPEDIRKFFASLPPEA